ncbi:MAG TPA: TssA family type VI secretion system protein [Ignavibacteriaceae bacterium]|nr:TssA family type VI secretion system protein [Ignavibacteriaceae bacterium]
MKEIDENLISDFAKEFLDSIPGDSAAGIDAANGEEYFKLNMEIAKTAPDYKLIIELAGIILKEKSKDIKVACWLCFALFRTEKIKGLKDGLSIIYYLLSKFEDNLFPSNTAHRGKALQFLNTSRFTKLVEKEEINKSNAEDVIEAGKVLNLIIDESGKLFTKDGPSLKALQEVLQEHVSTANSVISQAKQKPEAPKPEPLTPTREDIIEKAKDVVVTAEGKIEKQSAEEHIVMMPVAPPKEHKLISDKDAIAQIRQALTFFFEADHEGNKSEKIPSPESVFVFGLSREFQWSRLIRPLDNDKMTQVEPPNKIIQSKIKEWYTAGSWDTLIVRIETNFLRPDSEFPYWLDPQRYVVKALEQKGGNYLKAAEAVKFHLAKLLNRIPDLVNLKFRDMQTPFADEETLNWINEEVKNTLGGGKSESNSLPPIVAENYDHINKEYESFLKELPGKFEENLSAMQQGVETDTSLHAKFIRKLNIASYCFNAKQYDLSKVFLAELKKEIELYNLSDWEPALSTAVWKTCYLINSKIAEEIKDEGEIVSLQREQKELFNKIAKYDGILAIKLNQNKK